MSADCLCRDGLCDGCNATIAHLAELEALLREARAEADECVRRGHADCHAEDLCDRQNVALGRRR